MQAAWESEMASGGLAAQWEVEMEVELARLEAELEGKKRPVATSGNRSYADLSTCSSLGASVVKAVRKITPTILCHPTNGRMSLSTPTPLLTSSIRPLHILLGGEGELHERPRLDSRSSHHRCRWVCGPQRTNYLGDIPCINHNAWNAGSAHPSFRFGLSFSIIIFCSQGEYGK